MKRLLHLIYGTSTRSAVCLNSICAVLWLCTVAVAGFGWVEINIPRELIKNVPVVHILSLAVIFFTLMYYRSFKRRKRVFKVASLAFGSLLQAIIGSFYVSNYPPFEPMFFTCSLLSMWLMGAVLNVFEVERDGRV